MNYVKESYSCANSGSEVVKIKCRSRFTLTGANYLNFINRP